MRNPQGYGIITDPSWGSPIEFDTITCNHCQRIVPIKARCSPSSIGAFCSICEKHICNQCHQEMCQGTVGCIPWEKKMDLIEKRDRAIKSYGI